MCYSMGADLRLQDLFTKYFGAEQTLKQIKVAFANEVKMVETLQNLEQSARTRGEQIQHLQNLLVGISLHQPRA